MIWNTFNKIVGLNRWNKQTNKKFEKILRLEVCIEQYFVRFIIMWPLVQQQDSQFIRSIMHRDKI